MIPFHVNTWSHGRLVHVEAFLTKEEAEAYRKECQQEEVREKLRSRAARLMDYRFSVQQCHDTTNCSACLEAGIIVQS